jgi:hypothetical protein
VHCGPPGQGNGNGHGGIHGELIALRKAVTGHAALALFGLLILTAMGALAIIRRRSLRTPGP